MLGGCHSRPARNLKMAVLRYLRSLWMQSDEPLVMAIVPRANSAKPLLGEKYSVSLPGALRHLTFCSPTRALDCLYVLLRQALPCPWTPFEGASVFVDFAV